MAVAVASATAAPVVDLYVQNQGNLPDGFGVFNDGEYADEFTVPAGQTWTVTGVRTPVGFAKDGPYYRVSFYFNAGGLPGTVACQRSAVQPMGSPTSFPSVGIHTPEYRPVAPCVLGPGSYFFGLRLFDAAGSGAQIEATPTITGNEARTRGNVCPANFVPVSTCGFQPTVRDIRFVVEGCLTANCEQPVVASASCSGRDATVTIRDGDGNFDIVGAGPGLPRANVPRGTVTIIGPARWPDMRVVERSGDLESLPLGVQNCGDHIFGGDFEFFEPAF